MREKSNTPNRTVQLRAEEFFGPELTRRGFLKGSVTGVLALSAASLLPASCAKYAPPPDDLKVFNAKEYAIINAAATIYVGTDLPNNEIDVARFFDQLSISFPVWIQDQVKQALGVFEHGTLPFAFTLKAFTEMSREAQKAYVDSWAESGLAFRRTVNLAIRNLCLGSYYLQQPAWKEMHYAGPWIGRMMVPTVALRYPLPEGSVKT